MFTGDLEARTNKRKKFSKALLNYRYSLFCVFLSKLDKAKLSLGTSC